MRGNNTSGYLFARNKTDQFRENKYSNLIQEDIQGNVILDFISYIPENNRIRIRAVDVKRFGLDSSLNHSVVWPPARLIFCVSIHGLLKWTIISR